MPAVFARVLAIRASDPRAVPRLAALLRLESDRRLHIVASGESGPDAPAPASAAVEGVIERAGFRRVQLATVLALVMQAMDGETASLDALEFWTFAATAGAVAIALADARRTPAVDLAGVAALLHDLGRLAIDEDIPGVLAAIAEEVSLGLPVEAAERRVLGQTIRDRTVRLLSDWDAPQALVAAVREYDRVPALPKTLPGIVRNAVLIAGQLTRGAGEPLAPATASRLWDYYGSPQQLLASIELLLSGPMLG